MEQLTENTCSFVVSMDSEGEHYSIDIHEDTELHRLAQWLQEADSLGEGWVHIYQGGKQTSLHACLQWFDGRANLTVYRAGVGAYATVQARLVHVLEILYDIAYA